MVVKTEMCFFTEWRIYPGHGRTFIRKDGKLLNFINQKVRSLYDQRKKAQRLTWTQQWRMRHKKGRAETLAKRSKKRVAKVFKAIAGLDLDALKKKRSTAPEARKEERDAKIRQAKEAARKAAPAAGKKDAAAAGKKDAKKPAAKKTNAGAQPFQKVTKARKALNVAVRR